MSFDPDRVSRLLFNDIKISFILITLYSLHVTCYTDFSGIFYLVYLHLWKSRLCLKKKSKQITLMGPFPAVCQFQWTPHTRTHTRPTSQLIAPLKPERTVSPIFTRGSKEHLRQRLNNEAHLPRCCGSLEGAKTSKVTICYLIGSCCDDTNALTSSGKELHVPQCSTNVLMMLIHILQAVQCELLDFCRLHWRLLFFHI